MKDAQDWIVVVDDDIENLRMAGRILTPQDMRVSCLRSGESAIDFLAENTPDLVLLDVHMPGIGGFETFEVLRRMHASANVPIIFLTADDDRETEAKGLIMGAVDFVRKPFIPDILILRVKTAISLNKLKNELAYQVALKTDEVIKQQERLSNMSMEIVKALSDAVDAKDTYTRGHSARVAEYAREISRRAGCTEEEQQNVYMMGLLHDVGKIGIPDSIINKPGRLTDEEFETIKKHPVAGWQILKNISDFPELAIGAKWHHERYDGKGYPDGLAGEKIPVQARMIAVADTYDAMTSNRSYRKALAQEVVRAELARGRGTQFDPFFADIMIQMIDEDKDYKMSE